MNTSSPAVMVSSTFYDLRQIRADLGCFLEDDLGYRALLSEHRSFPVDPDADTIENCRRRVEQDADLFVLVIGGRYGYVDPNSLKSITNLEYLVAQRKGIPIYAFVEKSVLSVLPVWAKNPQADFSDVVSDTRVFEFIQRVRSEDKIWMHEFEIAQEIIQTLRLQLAYLMRDGLQQRLQFLKLDNQFPRDLHGKALRLALEKPDAWEHRLFGQVLTDQVGEHGDLRKDHHLGLIFGSGDHLALEQVAPWMQARMEEIQRLVQAVNVVLGDNLQESLGPPGEPGSVEAIVDTARKAGAIYRAAINWSLHVLRAHVPECFRSAVVEMARMTDDLIEKVETFGPLILKEVEESLAAPWDGPQRVLNLVLTISLSNQEAFATALDEAKRNCFG
ncbi:MAG: DUF4062 domain-containing protein [Longimicrobiaceae bacterium]